jgi:hypothetical protein
MKNEMVIYICVSNGYQERAILRHCQKTVCVVFPMTLLMIVRCVVVATEGQSVGDYWMNENHVSGNVDLRDNDKMLARTVCR